MHFPFPAGFLIQLSTPAFIEEEFFLTRVLLEDLFLPLPILACAAFKVSLPPRAVLRCYELTELGLNSPSHKALPVGSLTKRFPFAISERERERRPERLRCVRSAAPRVASRARGSGLRRRMERAHATPVAFNDRTEPCDGGAAAGLWQTAGPPALTARRAEG